MLALMSAMGCLYGSVHFFGHSWAKLRVDVGALAIAVDFSVGPLIVVEPRPTRARASIRTFRDNRRNGR
jgi:hypothetical protein